MLSDAATALLNHYRPPVVPPAQRQWHTIAEGFYLDECGVVLGRCIDLDINVRGNYSPLYYYNRSWRFIGLLNVFQVPIRCQGRVLQCFEALEKVWEDTKEKYTRVYFLTQKLLLQEITIRLGIPSTQSSSRPISDLKRYKAQIGIFDDLWKILKEVKDESTTRREPTIFPTVRPGLRASP